MKSDLIPNTFGVAARCRKLVEIRSEEDLQQLADRAFTEPWMVLGEGSNVLFVGDYPGTVLLNRIRGRAANTDGPTSVQVDLGAGERWHDCVAWTLHNGWPGLENLALIPGTAGAAPVQNIGAYGVEFAQFLRSVEAFDPATGRVTEIDAEQCRLAYRDSLFKSGAGKELIITSVRLKLDRQWVPTLTYPSLARVCDNSDSPEMVFDRVVSLRRQKLPDIEQLGSAGSFFKNPSVDAQILGGVLDRHSQAPHWQQPDGCFRLSAAYLIDQLGWRGERHGDAGVFADHALVLVNHGQASGHDLWALACSIIRSVEESYGITLEPEPRIISGPTTS